MKSVLFSLFLLSIGRIASAQSPVGTIFPFDVREYTILDTASYRIDYRLSLIHI